MNQIVFETDFIYVENRKIGTLTLKTCKNSCTFCPAAKLMKFQNFSKVNSIVELNIRELKVYGNCNCSYIESILKLLKTKNPSIKIDVYGCKCFFTQEIDVIFHQIIHPAIDSLESTIEPIEYIIPAIGDPEEIFSFAKNFYENHPEIPISFQITDSADPDIEFWSPAKIEELQKKLN